MARIITTVLALAAAGAAARAPFAPAWAARGDLTINDQQILKPDPGR